jgi:hypothetical protein
VEEFQAFLSVNTASKEQNLIKPKCGFNSIPISPIEEL